MKIRRLEKACMFTAAAFVSVNIAYSSGISVNEEDLPIPTLKKESSYKLERIWAESSIYNEDFIVTKYLKVNGSKSLFPIAYKVTFPKGFGESVLIRKSFNWETSNNSIQLVEVAWDPNADVLASSVNNANVINNTGMEDINYSFLNLRQRFGGAILNHNSFIGNINGDFISNNANLYDTAGGAIYNNAGKIKNIVGHFIGNCAYAYSEEIIETCSFGGAIDNNYGVIAKIIGDFIRNSAYSISVSEKNATVKGGAVANRNEGYIESLNGDFIGNVVHASSDYRAMSYGGAIYNEGNIGAIIGDFIDNSASASASSTSGNAFSHGGAICNDGIIKQINGDFIGNYAFHSGAILNSGTIENLTGNFAKNYTSKYGGAIYNTDGIIKNITGDFVENHSGIYGGAIENFNGTIENINGDFINNHVNSSLGGAIYNTGTIIKITGDFIGNYSFEEGNTSLPNGGAICNRSENAVIEVIIGNFIGNYGKSLSIESYGGAISNYGTVESITGEFIDNHLLTSTYSYGGAIYNKGRITFNNSTFTGNYVSGSMIFNPVQGGAIWNGGTLNLNLSEGVKIKNIGNYAEGKSAKYDAKGGFLYMADGALANFDTAKNSSYIVGDGTVGFDSIASANANSIINKNGKGELIVNSSMEFYKGTLNINEGFMAVNNKLGASKIQIANGATLSAKISGNNTFGNSNLNYSNDGTLKLVASESLSAGKYNIFALANPEEVNFGNVKTYGGTFDEATDSFIVSNSKSIDMGRTSPTSVESNGRLEVKNEAITALVMNFNSVADVLINSVSDTTTNDAEFEAIVNSIDAEKLLSAKAYDFEVINLGTDDSVYLSLYVGDNYKLSQFTIYHKDDIDGWELADVSGIEYNGEYLSFIVNGFSSYGFVAAVPEPSTYAAIFGSLTMVFVLVGKCYRKRK